MVNYILRVIIRIININKMIYTKNEFITDVNKLDGNISLGWKGDGGSISVIDEIKTK
jgi:hypothetical protein